VNTLTRTRGDAVFDAINVMLMALSMVLILYPLYFVVIASISNPDQVNAGRVWFVPRDITFDGYRRIMNNRTIWTGYGNTIIYAVAGTAINLLLTIPAAYALSRRDFMGRDFFMILFTFTMFFAGGLIPLYLLVRSLGMLNTRWAMVLPNAILVWNLIVARTFFQHSIPAELLEAARMDGCTNRRFFVSVVLPLSPALLAVMVLFYAVGHWNSFFHALVFLRSERLYPLQLVLRDILLAAQMQETMVDDVRAAREQMRIADSIRYGSIIVASLPVLILYPFLQRYFVQGVMIGAIKG
jgi:putative aldouronate transport system permease protein